MGKEFSCLNVQNVQKGTSIHMDEQNKSKIATFKYINPVNFTKEELLSMNDISYERTMKRIKQSEEENKQNQRSSLYEQDLKEDEIEEIGDQILMQSKEPEAVRSLKKIKVKWDQFIKMKRRKFTDDYKIINEIGRGGFGCVYRVMMKTGKIYRAAKKIAKDQLKQEDHESLLAEMAIMKSLDHPNITKLFQVYDQKSFYVMVLELCEGGELFDRIVEKKIRQRQAKMITFQVLSAINYLHSLGIVHRDIKPQNMLYEKKTKLVKIIDFGISSKIKPGQFLTSRVGTPYYIAPEVLHKHYNQKYDIWSLGIVLYMIVYNTPPFVGNDPPEVMRKILHDPVKFKMTPSSSKFSPQCIEFIKKMLNKDVNQRLSARQLLDDNWLKDQKTLKPVKSDLQNEALTRITQFHFKNKLQAVVHTYIVSQLLTSEQRTELLGLFRSIDKNQNGIIDSEEIRLALENKNFEKIDEQKVKKIIDFVDTNCSGQIDYTQFLVAAIDFDSKVTQKHFQQAFAYFDIDNSGEITFEEVAAFLEEELDNEQIKNLFRQIDKNGDGQISKAEFVELLVGKEKSSL